MFAINDKRVDPWICKAYSIIHDLQVEETMKNGKIVSLIGIGGGHAINSNLAILRMLYKTGNTHLITKKTYICIQFFLSFFVKSVAG